MIILLIVNSISIVHAIEDNQNNTNGDSIVKKSFTSMRGVEFITRFKTNNNKIIVTAKNSKNSISDTYFTLIIDDSILIHENLKLQSKEEWRKEYTIRDGLKVTKEDHTIIASTIGSDVRFNLSKNVKSRNQTTIPKPKITDIAIENGTIDGQPSAVAKVTVENPSIHTYPTKLMVHTQETDGSFYGASVPPGESRTFTVELLDERGAKIAGEARLYTGNLTTAEGAMDQVEFVGEADADTSQWNASYEPVNPPWMENRYKYENESLDESTWAERVSNGYAIGGVPAVYVGLGGVAAMLLGGLTRRVV